MSKNSSPNRQDLNVILRRKKLINHSHQHLMLPHLTLTHLSQCLIHHLCIQVLTHLLSVCCLTLPHLCHLLPHLPHQCHLLQPHSSTCTYNPPPSANSSIICECLH